MIATAACRLCGSDQVIARESRSRYRYVQCVACSLAFVANPPSNHKVLEQYNRGASSKLAYYRMASPADARSFQELLDLVETRTPRASILDIGCNIGTFVRGKGKFVLTEYVPTDERTGPRFPLLLTTGRILSQYNVGAQTRRTENVAWHDEDVLEIHPHDAENRGIRDGDRVALISRSGETTLRAHITERVQPGVIYTTFHHPESGANVVTTDFSDWATGCPEYKVTAVEVRLTNHESSWQERYEQLKRLQRIETVAAE